MSPRRRALGPKIVGTWLSDARPHGCLERLSTANRFDSAAGNIWLKHWSEINDENRGNPDVGKYIGIYFAFGFGASLLMVVQNLILWILCSIEVSSCGVATAIRPDPLLACYASACSGYCKANTATGISQAA